MSGILCVKICLLVSVKLFSDMLLGLLHDIFYTQYDFLMFSTYNIYVRDCEIFGNIIKMWISTVKMCLMVEGTEFFMFGQHYQ